MNILILPGDGIGKEICFEVEKLFKELNSIFSIDINFETSDFGGSAIKKYNNPFPKHTAENVIASDAVILGAVGGPMFDDLEGEMKPESGLLKLRKNNNLYINLRPIFSFTHAIESSPLKKEIISNLDILIIRELVGGLYFGEPRGFNSDRTEGYNTMRYTKTHINKILKFAFEVSSLRNKIILIPAVISGGIKTSHQVWSDCFRNSSVYRRGLLNLKTKTKEVASSLDVWPQKTWQQQSQLPAAAAAAPPPPPPPPAGGAAAA